jgi:cytochrome oxidase Cu insertion factor (SCO1/SenC/PrrC family)/thiol-disulfide isomerase/thioredoxin
MLRTACRLLLVLAVMLGAASALATAALADGDPGSDVLVYQPLFFEPDANVPVSAQVSLGDLLTGLAKTKNPVRVALISSPADLGAISAAWLKPREYAPFLGTELSQAYSGRLLVVMPNGYGYFWLGHSSPAGYAALAALPAPGSGGKALASGAESAIRALAAAAHFKLPATSGALITGGSSSSATVVPGSTPILVGGPPSASSSTRILAFAALITLALLIVGLRIFYARRGKQIAAGALTFRQQARGLLPPIRFVVPLLLPLALAFGAYLLIEKPAAPISQRVALLSNDDLDPGTAFHRQAPPFTLVDQNGKTVSLKQFRGKVVILSFDDSECQTVCPISTTAMLDAKAMLGHAGRDVQLLGIDANPKSNSIEDVASYTEVHGMVGQWDFLTGTLAQLRPVWKAYSVTAEITAHLVDHTPAVFVIGRTGRLVKLFLTAQSYAAIGQFGQLLANTAATALPGDPKVDSHLSYQHVAAIPPTDDVAIPRYGGGKVQLGPGKPRLFVFFASWDRQITDLAAGLNSLGGYEQLAERHGLPEVTAVDEAAVEPPGALVPFIKSLKTAPPFPIGIDRSGQIADGYEVDGQPWLVLVNAQGDLAWSQQITGLKWPTPDQLVHTVKTALAHVPTSPGAIRSELAGSPAPLAALHRQSSKLLPGGWPALLLRLESLRGHPVVLNIWASWCQPCQEEFKLFATASAQYGKSVAFLGADVNDNPASAASFLTQHHVSYPSYWMNSSAIPARLVELEGTPETVFINAAGHPTYVNDGAYLSQGALDNDIATYAYGTVAPGN